MALYLMKCRFLQRSKGHSATGLGAYMLDQNGTDPWDGKEHKQEGRHDDADHEKMVAFTVSPCDDPFQNHLDVFQAVDAFERRKDATLGKEYEVALQHELTIEQNIEAVRQFCEQAKAEGLYCVAALHFKRGNFHAHIYESDRTFSVENGEVKWGTKNNTQEANRQRVERRRERWAAAVNSQFEQAGLDERIDHRSYKDRGLEWEREIPEGKNPSSDVQERNAAVRKAKQQRNLKAAAEAQHEASQAIAKAQELDNEIAEEILTDYIPPAQVARVPVAKNLPPVGVASMDAALASITPTKKKAPEPEPPKRDLPEVVPGLGAMRTKPQQIQYDDDYDPRKPPQIIEGVGALKKKDESAPAYTPSWGNGPGF
ncbi:MAG: MobA/MobL family protein [Kiritimatiellia bacterium]